MQKQDKYNRNEREGYAREVLTEKVKLKKYMTEVRD